MQPTAVDLGYRYERAVSSDGVSIAYRRYGSGAPVVIVHGGMQSAYSFSRLAKRLATDFTVIVPERRGRGRSGRVAAVDGLDAERRDLLAVLDHSGARDVFGLSSGALIALSAALESRAIERLALYEPPLSRPGREHEYGWTAGVELALDRGQLARAMVEIIKATGDEGVWSSLPRALLVPMVTLALLLEARRSHDDHMPLAQLVPLFRQDIRVQRAMAGPLSRFAAVDVPVLLLGGARSCPMLRDALVALEQVLPNAHRVEIAGVGHVAASDRGRPELVARELHRFFSDRGEHRLADERSTTAPARLPQAQPTPRG